ncbi:MAG: type II toxin-antitoxin system RelE/ParE family toxin [Bacteroidetes bacterium]|nr:type II toxin-antitoxin system RelE/ParE family toxin [Bacteroidota bacterium]
MVKSVILTLEADVERKQILQYWNERNHSNNYSKKLDKVFRANFNMLASFPKMGKSLGINDLRVLVVKDYLFVYREIEEFVEIISIWDSRRDPNKLKTRFK